MRVRCLFLFLCVSRGHFGGWPRGGRRGWDVGGSASPYPHNHPSNHGITSTTTTSTTTTEARAALPVWERLRLAGAEREVRRCSFLIAGFACLGRCFGMGRALGWGRGIDGTLTHNTPIAMFLGKTVAPGAAAAGGGGAGAGPVALHARHPRCVHVAYVLVSLAC